MKEIQGYELLEEKQLKDIHSTGYYLKHKKSGAHVLLISNDDENKVFNITFRTPPSDHTGVPHILEHSVLCGSKKYPLKDPFVELVKGSMNTFLNAMTYPDKTMYPVASCNDQDFQNLMNVYMDAVFFTNIYDHEEIFRQEGWSYALESEDDKLTYNGVVYNEMKGAFSSPEGVLDREILNSLFPDTPYSNESGGDPEYIPDLTYSQFLSFHSRYYHPANSYIYLYGDMDMAEKLEWLDKEYLSKYDEMPIESEIGLQEPFSETKEVRMKYSIAEADTEEDNTYLSYNMVIGTSLDIELCMAFQVLEYALLSAPGAALKQALLDKRIGKDIMGSYDNGTYQPIFSVIAKNSNLDSKEAFLETIRTVLETAASSKIDRKALLAGINHMEFKFREADYGRYPKGLVYCIESFNSWLYDKQNPFLYLEQLSVFEFLKAQVETDYYEKLIEKYLLNNSHASIVIVEPEKGLTAKLDRETDEKLQAYKASLSKEEIQALVDKTHALIAYQEAPSTKEEMECLPMLKRSDLKTETGKIYNTELTIEDTLVLHHDIETNGIGYLSIMFDTHKVPKELISYMGILSSVLGYISTQNYTYNELFNEININTGGIQTTINTYANVKEPSKSKTMFEIKSKVLYEKLGFAFSMFKEILFTSKFEDEKRLYEIIAQLKSRLQMQLTSSGHVAAANRAQSYFSKLAYMTEQTSGIAFYKVIERIESNFEQEKADLIANLKLLLKYIFRPENMMVSYTANQTGFAGLEQEIKGFKPLLCLEEVEVKPYTIHLEKKNEGFMTSSKIQYVARAGNFRQEGNVYSGALKILKVILGYDYLWNHIRVKGGAYGCMNGYSKIGDSYFVSYRDPNLEKTNQVFEGVADYVRNIEIDERDMTKYIIGTVSDLDTPLSPSGKGHQSLAVYMTAQNEADMQKERDEILAASLEDIRKLADLLQTIIDQNYLCVIGNEENLKEQKELFDNLLPFVE